MPRPGPALLGLALLLAACSGGSGGSGGGSIADNGLDGFGTIYWRYYSTSYAPTDIAFAGGSGQLLTQILGNPFGGPQEQFDTAVTNAMYGAHFGPPTRFTTTPVGNFKRIFAVRLVFDATYPVTVNTICSIPPESPKRTAPGNGTVRLSAAFCQSGDALTYLDAGGSGYSGPDDPRFVQFIRQVTTRLFPPQNPELRRGQEQHCKFNTC